jgi:hypothetical protein
MTAVLAVFLLGAASGATACGANGENPSTRSSASRPPAGSIDRSSTAEPDSTRSREPERTTAPAETTRPPTTTAVVTPEPTRTTRTTAPAAATTRPPTSSAVVVPAPTRTTRTSTPAETTPAPVAPASAAPASAAPASAESQGPGPFGWSVLIVLVAAMIVGGFLVYRSQRRSAWDAEARALESETRAVVAVRLPPVLSTTTTGQRGLAWPPVRAALTDAQSRWTALIERASGEDRRNWSRRMSDLLQELVEAVDAENEALAAGREWMPLRPRVNRAEHALAAVLAGQPEAEPPAAGEPGPPAFQT